MVHAQILLFYSTIIGGLWQKTVTATRGCISQKGSIKVSHSNNFDLQDQSRTCYYATFKLKFMYSQLPHNA